VVTQAVEVHKVPLVLQVAEVNKDRQVVTQEVWDSRGAEDTQAVLDTQVALVLDLQEVPAHNLGMLEAKAITAAEDSQAVWVSLAVLLLASLEAQGPRSLEWLD